MCFAWKISGLIILFNTNSIENMFGDMKNIFERKNDIDITSELKNDEPLHTRQFSEASLHTYSCKEVF